MIIWKLFIKTLFIASPIIFAALLHGIVMKFNLFSFIKKPMDIGITLRGKPLFGPNKTWRGLVISSIGTVIFSYVIAYLYFSVHFFKNISIVNFDIVSPLHIGLSLGIGMILGELPNSFLKRQFSIDAGSQGFGGIGFLFRIYDQIDLLIGVWLLLFLVPNFSVIQNLDVFLFSIIFALVIHFIISLIGYKIGMRDTPF